MTVVDTDIDESVVLLHEFDYELPCDFQDESQCGNAAEWRLVKRCCGKVTFLCDDCMRDDKEWIEGGYSPVITCTRCFKTLKVNTQAEAYITIERI
jgi:hypothetical protein